MVKKQIINDEIEALASRRLNWLNAIYDGNANEIVYFLTTDAFIILPDQMLIKGPDSIRKWLKVIFEQFQCKWLLSDVKRREVRNNCAFETGVFHLSATSRINAARIKNSWNYIVMWRLTEGEDWKVKICVIDQND